MTDQNVLNPGPVVIDIAMDDDDTSSTPSALLQGPAVLIKTEPRTEPFESIEMEPLPELAPSTMDKDVPTNLLADELEGMPAYLEDDMAGMLEEYNANGAAERVTSVELDYERALSAVENKRKDMAMQASLGNLVDEAERIKLKSLEGTLYQARKFREKEREHMSQQSMFFPEEDFQDEHEPMVRTPTRNEAIGNLDEQNRISEDDDFDNGNSSQRVTQGRKTGQRGGKGKTTRKPPATKGKTRVSKKVPAPRGLRGSVRGQGSGFGITNIASLARNNIVEDARINQTLGSQPTFKSTTRKDALAQLIASIPKDQQSTSRGMKTKLDKACKQFKWKGPGSMQATPGGGWKLKGMESSLEHFQLLGAAWGVEREAAPNAPYGGILADTMGFGKTVQMITIMVENQPLANRKNRTTLIVVPNSIVDQWLSEIAKHTQDGIMESVIIYKSGARILGEDPCRRLKQYACVITTYHEVMRQYPKCEPPLHLVTDKAKDDWWHKHFEENKGPLLSMPFYRIVLDEAHLIKNHESRTSKACRFLTAKYKWVLTGTPLSNCMEEMYPYFDFLGVEGAGSYAQFRNNYCKRNDVTMQRLDAMLRKIMLRRTGSDRLFGAPLVSLPALDYQTISVQFNQVEKTIYSVVRQRFISRINDWSTSGKIQQLSRNIFVMLLRLRQMCSHILSVESTIRDLLEAEDIEKLWKAVERHSQGSTSDAGMKTAHVLKRILREAQDEEYEARSTPPEGPSDPRNDTIDLTINDSAFDFRGFFFRLQQTGSWDNVRGRSHCNQCNDIPEEGRAKLSVPCGHLYCEECLTILLESAQQAKLDSAQCSACHGPVTGTADLTAMERIAADAGSYPRAPRASPPSAQNGRKKRKPPASEAWLSMPEVEKLSTKVQAITSTMEDWIKNDPTAKIVIFTLFLPMVKVLAKVCSKHGWGYSEFTGEAKAEVRNASLQRWKSAEDGQKVLLMSMKAGGLGLNLIEASYCIIVDPWWNEPAEDQAFSRVYRIGQHRDCVVRRFVIEDAIDTQLMLRLQKLKAQECDRIVDGRSNQELSIPELMRLFGPTRRDPETNEIIIENDDDDGVDEFIIGQDHLPVDDSDVEETLPAPARPKE